MCAEVRFDVLRQKAAAVGWRCNREVAHSLVGKSCNITTTLECSLIFRLGLQSVTHIMWDPGSMFREVIILSAQLKKTELHAVHIGDSLITVSHNVRNLGVQFDETRTMESYITASQPRHNGTCCHNT